MLASRPQPSAPGANTIASWRTRRSFSAAEFPLERLLEAKRQSVAVVLPAREVAETVAGIARSIVALGEAGLIDEAVVIDASSRDGSAALAAATGIRVLQQDELAPELGRCLGKGDAMWRGLQSVSSEIVAFLDADTHNFDRGFVTGLLGPLICAPEIDFVKGRFARPLRVGSRLAAGEGGRVTELMARPFLNLHAPELAAFDQPLAGEVAARRTLLERMPFCVGYGVEIGMLIDAWRLVSLDGLSQVDLGERHNGHQPLRDLSAMAYAVLVAASNRLLAERLAPEPGEGRRTGAVALPPLQAGGAMELRAVPVGERPALSS